eukprot:gene8132-12592_t
MLQTEKPILQNKKTRRGIRSGNTIKYEVTSCVDTTKPTTFTIADLKEKQNKRGITYSINKNKGWEELERIKENPKYIVEEDYCFIKTDKSQYHKFLQTQKVTVDLSDEKEPIEIIQGRKGKTIKKKREIKGKKGIKQIEEKEKENFDQVEYIVHVEPTEPKKGQAFQHDWSDGYWKKQYSERNRTFRKRRENKRNCVL